LKHQKGESHARSSKEKKVHYFSKKRERVLWWGEGKENIGNGGGEERVS